MYFMYFLTIYRLSYVKYFSIDDIQYVKYEFHCDERGLCDLLSRRTLVCIKESQLLNINDERERMRTRIRLIDILDCK